MFLHELGHFVAAKRFGVIVHEFSIGMGPRLFGFGKGETKYSVRLLPLGGYVKLEGEGETEESDNPRSFSNLSPIKRIIILFAGAFMNILLGFLLFTVINVKTGIVPAKIAAVPDEFIEETVFLKDDEIIKLDNTRIHTFDDVSLFMSRCDSNISVTVRRNGEIKTFDDFLPFKTENGYKLGVSFASQKASFLKSAEYAVYDTVYITKAVFFALGDLICGRAGLNTLSGPVEIVSVVGEVASQKNSYTVFSVLMLFAMITVNLGIFNLLPFPALDGGSIVFAFYELITGRKVKSEILGYASMIGFALLMILALFVTVGDITDLIKNL